jgi:integrase/recombinase XerD
LRRIPIEVSGPLAAYVAGYQTELRRLGYTESPVRKHFYLLARLSRWLGQQGMGAADVATPRVEPFFAARRAAGVANLRTARSLAPFIAYLREAGALTGPDARLPLTASQQLAASFAAYLARERGLAEGTIRFYARIAAMLAESRPADAGMAGLTAGEVTAFTAGACRGRGASSSRQVVSALRSFLRFLAAEGLAAAGLDDAVLPAAGAACPLPRAIGADTLARLLSGCQKGSRDHAIVLLLARLGLRGGEVVAMELSDIDWRAGELIVRGKGRRIDRLPLMAEAGEALAAYLQGTRPASHSRRVFLRQCAPFEGLASTGALRGVLARACQRAGIGYVSPHQLRHTAATQMLAAGASLQDIGQVLRHRSIVTTSSYARVDFSRLRSLARPWPGDAA